MLLKITPIRPGMSAKRKLPKYSRWRIRNWRTNSETDTLKLHSYTQQKNFTKGLVDLALLTANANQLIEAIQFKDELMKTLFIVLISLSITLQVVQSMCL